MRLFLGSATVSFSQKSLGSLAQPIGSSFDFLQNFCIFYAYTMKEDYSVVENWSDCVIFTWKRMRISERSSTLTHICSKRLIVGSTEIRRCVLYLEQNKHHLQLQLSRRCWKINECSWTNVKLFTQINATVNFSGAKFQWRGELETCDLSQTNECFLNHQFWF